MKRLKLVSIVFVTYAAIIVGFESLIGYFQPADESTLVITTFDSDGVPHGRAVSPVESNGQLYVPTNHWIRGWYNRALEIPDVQVTRDGKMDDYRAVPVTGVEHDRVATENRLGVVLRILTGFPPRYFVRLDPR
jgi:hypothetical protein